MRVPAIGRGRRRARLFVAVLAAIGAIAVAGCSSPTDIQQASPTVGSSMTPTPNTIPTEQLIEPPTSNPPETATSTPTPSASPTHTITPILFDGTPVLPLDSLSEDETFVGALTLLREIEIPPTGFKNPVFMPDSSEVVYDFGQSLRHLDLRSNQFMDDIVPSIKVDILDFVITHDGEFAILADGRELVVVQLPAGEVVDRVEVGTAYISEMEPSPYGNHLASLDFDGEIVVYDATTWEELFRFQHSFRQFTLSSVPKFLRGGSELAAAGEGGYVNVLNFDGEVIQEVYIGSQGELELSGDAGGSLVLGDDLDFTIQDPLGTIFGVVSAQTERFDIERFREYQITVLNADGEKIASQWLLDSGTYQLRDSEGELLGTVQIRARRVAFRTADGDLMGTIRLGFPEFGGILVETLDEAGQPLDEEFLHHGSFLTVSPDGETFGTYTAGEFRCIDREMSVVTCSIPYRDPAVIISPWLSSFPDGYWLAFDKELSLSLIDFIGGREAFRSQPFELYDVKGAALSPNKAFVALIITKSDSGSSYLQIWGYPAP
ncbi:MAG: hypothetical protein ACC700_20595 [Anaerolineales bacterium]